jgi:CubicO group peptidase (beta-lactamase class C family)
MRRHNFGLYKVLSLKLLLLSLFCMFIIASSGFFPMALQRVLAQQSPTPPPPTSNSWVNNSTSAHKEHLSMALLNQIKPMILKNMGNKSTGGVSIVVGVIIPNGTSVSGYGNISKANTTKVNGDTLFDIGSNTKTFTTALLVDMVKRGLVKLDDPLQKYLPSYVKVPTYHNDGHNITLEDLATHTSGLPDLPPKLFDNHTYPTQQIYNYISHSSLVSEPGVRYKYNNLGLGLLGYVLSLKAGMPYRELVKDRILNVLGMNSTGIAMNSTQITTPLPDILKSRLAKGHIGGREVSLAFLPEVIQPAGAFYSSANNLLKYLSANMGLINTKINDILQDTHLIRHEETSVANSSTTTQSLLAVYIGLGWDIVTNLGTEVVYHTGGIDGYVSLVAFNPTKQTGLVILCSCDENDAVLPANWIKNVILSLLRSSGIFAPGEVAPITNANASGVRLYKGQL